MIASSSHQAWLFYSPLARQAARLKDDLLDPVDQLLDDPAFVDLVRQCLAKRSPRSTRTGRMGMAPDRLLRCSVMKHVKGWSFRDLERELRSNLVIPHMRNRGPGNDHQCRLQHGNRADAAGSDLCRKQVCRGRLH